MDVLDPAGGLLPDCPAVHRPAALLAPTAPAHGLRGAGVRTTGAGRIVDVWLYGTPPAQLAEPRRWTLQAARGAQAVQVSLAAVVAAPEPHVELTLTGTPDPGRYLLQVLPERAGDATHPPLALVPFDPLRTRLPVRLRPECPDPGSCFETPPARPPRRASPVHDYLARDWRSLRAALIEYLLRRDPAADLSPADPAITVLELFAHAGDLLHYRLDRMATEAYLGTARLRTSVRRHARLMDHVPAEAVSATAWVLLQAEANGSVVDVRPEDTAVASAGETLGFTLELEQPLSVHPALGEIPIYDWGEDACCLPAGATECVLVRPLPADAAGAPWLLAGDALVFEVVDPEDRARHRAWSRRDPAAPWPAVDGTRARFREPLPSRAAAVVTLTEVTDLADPLAPTGMRLSRVRWRAADALPRPYPVGIDTGAGGDEVTVARGHLVRAHHGRLVGGPSAAAPRDGGRPGEVWLTGGGTGGVPGVSRRSSGTPYRLELRVLLPSGGRVLAEHVPSLLAVTSATQLAYVLEVEDHEPPVARFRTGAVGLAPPLGSQVRARYEVGAGEVGNVPAGALQLLERNSAAGNIDAAPVWTTVPGVVARNPEAAAGGREPVPLDATRRDAPQLYVAAPRRAVSVVDHAAAVAREPGVQGAAAERSWSGSWPVVQTVVDLLDTGTGAPEPDDVRLAELSALVDDIRMLGTEGRVSVGTAAGLVISLEVCATPGADPEEVRRRVLAVLRPGTAQAPGLFSPSRLQLGRPVYVSAVLAAVSAVPGVDAVEVREARRLGEPPGTVHQVLTAAATELPVLDDDPATPTRGRLDVVVRGTEGHR
ncbi:hypothetical protein ACI797_11465 [Geodermatophilus sp. SYSU D00691]